MTVSQESSRVPMLASRKQCLSPSRMEYEIQQPASTRCSFRPELRRNDNGVVFQVLLLEFEQQIAPPVVNTLKAYHEREVPSGSSKCVA
ncbi:hypothetical protein PAAG_04933 [Paracoccidioides lutzii Pb01]|uniref:Uncharacterized protein n=1 Tax=Paracoccidioides lutzii (strain ATCC MYA-826 / Pb01) TaxID=502779 RepID=C1H1Z7_PARBA|nr:hypothetical protein PAAG_04933 [Paracoccidioides lutzii Pb01]EEH33884.2 hypothetical protein PAAG_04933 [Paracoccidioides lutzii Pb01]